MVEPTWVVDGESLGFARGGGVIDRHGERIPFLESMEKGQDWVHRGAFDSKARLQVMDESGIYAQVLFPSIIGLGGQSVNGTVGDPELRRLCIEIYNDAMAEIGEGSGGRFIGMPVLPAWDVGCLCAGGGAGGRDRVAGHQHDDRPAGPGFA